MTGNICKTCENKEEHCTCMPRYEPTQWKETYYYCETCEIRMKASDIEYHAIICPNFTCITQEAYLQ